MKKILASAMLSAAMLSTAAAQAPAAAPETAPAVSAQPDAIPPTQLPAPAPAPAQSRSMEWIGFVGGALLVVIGGIVIYRRTRKDNAPAGGPYSGFTQQGAPAAAPPAPVQPQPAPAAPAPQWNGPAGFDSAAFLRDAKASFIRMQAAWDKADTVDLREFTTPQVFGELAAQIEGRGHTADVTEVVTIDAELLGIEPLGEDYLASVKFTGLIKAAPGAQPEPFAEVWNMSRPLGGGQGWMLAGIQQLS